jgi:ribonuclease P protein component
VGKNKSHFCSLTRKTDFLKLRAKGQAVHVNGWLLANIQKTETGQLRCGWTISRQVGTAVLRNKLRRWGREYLRRWSQDHCVSADFNLIFKRRETGFYKTLGREEFDEAMAKIGARLLRLHR